MCFKYLHLNFMISFGATVFIALVVSIFIEWHSLYEQKFSAKALALLTIIGCLLAGTTTVLAVVLIDGLGLSGQASTIICCVAVKIIEQLLLSRWLCAHKPCVLCVKK